MSYSLSGPMVDDLLRLKAEQDARAKYEEEYAKTHNGVKPPPEFVEKYMKEHPEIAKPSTMDKASSFMKYAVIGVAAIVFVPVVIGLIKKK